MRAGLDGNFHSSWDLPEGVEYLGDGEWSLPPGAKIRFLDGEDWILTLADTEYHVWAEEDAEDDEDDIYRLIRWDGAHAYKVGEFNARQIINYSGLCGVSSEELPQRLERYAATEDGCTINAELTAYVPGIKIRVCGGCSDCGRMYDPDGRFIIT